MTRSRLLLAAVLVWLVGACTVSTNDQAVVVDNELFEPVLSTTTTTTSTTAPDVTKTVDVYFLRTTDGGARLQSVSRRVDVDAAAQEILSNLFTVRPDSDEPDEAGLISAIPESAELLSATNVPGSTRLVVDVRGLFGDTGIQGNDLRNALAQIVFTATESADVTEVVFRDDGEPQSAIVGSGETTDQPVRASDYDELR